MTWNIFEAALAVAQKFSKDDVMFETCFEVHVCNTSKPFLLSPIPPFMVTVIFLRKYLFKAIFFVNLT